MKKILWSAVVPMLFLARCAMQQGGGDDVTTYGYLYLEDGSPASGSTVSLIPAGSQPGSGSVQAYSSTTDSKGKYGFSRIVPGGYNVYGQKGTMVSYQRDVVIDSVKAPDPLPNDTLKLPGEIRGTVRLTAGGDCRTVLIMVIGGTMIGWPEDSTGVFSLKGLAEGYYRIRFLSTLNYPVLDTAYDVFSGKITDIGVVEIQPR